MTSAKPPTYNAASVAAATWRVMKNSTSEPSTPKTPKRLATLLSGLAITWTGTDPNSGIAISS